MNALSLLQKQLEDLYRIEVPPIKDFLCTCPEILNMIKDRSYRRRQEVLIVVEGSVPYVALYLDQHVVDVLNQKGLDRHLEAFWIAAEGISHFNYLSFRLHIEDSLSNLELELQAEVDKYALALLTGRKQSMAYQYRRRVRRLLFENARYLDPRESALGQRYRLASKAALRYTNYLEKYFVQNDLYGFIRELRNFYRIGKRNKLEYAWILNR